MAAVTSARRDGGFTLVEVLVAAALLTAVALLSAELVIQSTKLIDSAARATRNPDLVLATQWIRRDCYETLAVVGSPFGWTSDPLVLTRQDGGRVVFAVDDDELTRTDARPGAVAADTRVLLRGVVGWRWRVDDGVAVRLEIGSLVNPQAHENLTGVATGRVARRTERLVLALRGRPGGRGW